MKMTFYYSHLNIVFESSETILSIKLFDSELKVMDVIWRNETVTAKRIAQILGEGVGWSKATTYTLIRRCIKKGAIERVEPNFVCRALIPKEKVREMQTDEFLDKLYDGSSDQLIAALLGRKKCSPKKIDELVRMINKLE